jgi:hypothetical protein
LIIQVVGLPCSGKSFYINNFIEKYPEYNFIKKDILDFSGKYREREFLFNIIENKDSNLFVESACGLSALKSTVVLVRASKEDYLINMQKRQEKYTKNQLEHIDSQIIPANYTVYNQESFEALILTLLGAKHHERINHKPRAAKRTI